MTDEELLELLRSAALAVRRAVSGQRRLGLSGGRVSQYHADVAADRAALEVLLGGGLSVVSEESGRSGSAALTCVLDPIDGSTNFDRGIPFYSTSMCVLDPEGLRVAVVVNHATDEWYEAARGRGATKDGEPIAPSGSEELARSIVSCAGTPTANPGWAQFRALGSASLEICAVADGTLDGFVLLGGARLHPWDYLGGLLVAREAGAEVVELDDLELEVPEGAPRRLVAASTSALLEVLVAYATGPPRAS